MAQCDETMVVDAFGLVDREIHPNGETLVYTQVIEMYVSLLQDDEV